jgi:sodium/bile acid cotransporter 7
MHTKVSITYLAIIMLIVMLMAGICYADSLLSDNQKQQKIQSMYEKYKKRFPGVDDISAQDAMDLMKKKPVVFVDIRQSEEQAISMLPHAITGKEFLQNPGAYKDHTIISYCTISYRSGKLAEKLKKKGIHMINLRGGLLAWLHAGGKVYRDGRSVRRVHVYGKKWDLAPSHFETVF